MVFGAILAIIGIGLFAAFTWFRGGEVGRNRIKLFQAEFDLSQPSLVIFAAGCIMIVLPIILDQVGSDDPNEPPPTQEIASARPTEPVNTVAPTQPPPTRSSATANATAPLVTVEPTEPPVTVLPRPPFVTVEARESIATVPPSTSPALTDLSGIWHSSFGGKQGYVAFFRSNPTVAEYDFQHHGHSDPLFGKESFPLVGSGTAKSEGTILSIENTNPSGFGSYSGELQVDGSRTVGIVTDGTGDPIPVVLSLLPDYVETVFVSGEARGPRISVPDVSSVHAHVKLDARFPTLGDVLVEIRGDRPGSYETEKPCPFPDEQWEGEKEFVCAFTVEQPTNTVIEQWFVRVSLKPKGRIAIFVYDPQDSKTREGVTQFR